MNNLTNKVQQVVAVCCFLIAGIFYVYNTANDCVILDNDTPHAEVLAQLGTTGNGGTGGGAGDSTPGTGNVQKYFNDMTCICTDELPGRFLECLSLPDEETCETSFTKCYRGGIYKKENVCNTEIL